MKRKSIFSDCAERFEVGNNLSASQPKTAKDLLGKQITIQDLRTGFIFSAKVRDVKSTWGKLRLRIGEDTPWFEPTDRELESVK